jgi:hypothetical protein
MSFNEINPKFQYVIEICLRDIHKVVSVDQGREISIQGKGIYSSQSTTKVAVCAEKLFVLFFKQPCP